MTIHPFASTSTTEKQLKNVKRNSRETSLMYAKICLFVTSLRLANFSKVKSVVSWN